MKGFSFHINPRHKHLYLVAAFLGIMLTAGLTVGFMTGKLVNPFNKAGEPKPICYHQQRKNDTQIKTVVKSYNVFDQCEPQEFTYKDKHPIKCEIKKARSGMGTGNGTYEYRYCSCTYRLETQVSRIFCEFRCTIAGFTPSPTQGWLDDIDNVQCIPTNNIDTIQQKKCEHSGGTYDPKTKKCIICDYNQHYDPKKGFCVNNTSTLPSSTPTSKPPVSYTNLCITSSDCSTCCEKACANQYELEQQCYNECLSGCNQKSCTKARCDKECAKDGQIFLGICRDDGKCMCRDPKSTPTPTPTSQTSTTQSDLPEGCKDGVPYPDCYVSDSNTACVRDGVASGAPNSRCGPDDDRRLICCPASGGSQNTSSGSSSSSSTSDCDPSYLIPLTISSATVDTSSCSNDTYTVKYTIKIHADNADKKECGGGHFTLTATFPSTVKFGSGATASASPSASASNNVVTWANRYVYDNSDQTYTLTASIPKTQITSSTLNTSFKITLGDHTKDGGTLQTAKSSNVGTCYTSSSTNAGTGDNTSDSNPTTNTGSTYYNAPNTGLLDEHPVLLVAFISGLAILEATFGIFSKTIVKLKEFVE